jgi:TM2 domain-containing membrane protein YozV
MRFMNADWYPDPNDSTIQRYWDGSAWTEQTAPLVQSASIVPTSPTAMVPTSMVPAGYPAAATYTVAPKNPGLSLLVSFFFPGVGSMMNGDVGKGIGILVGYIVSLILTLFIVGLIGVFGFWIWGMVDAYSGAKKWNLAHGIIS